MGKKINIFTIIVTYNARKWLDRCLGSLRNSTIPTTVVVVDNGSIDGTVDVIRAKYSEMVLLEQDKNLGFGQGNNVGIHYALSRGASHVLLLNQDAWIEKDMLAKLCQYNDGQSLLSPIHMTGEGDAIDYNFEHHAMMRSKEYARYQKDMSNDITGHYETDEINAACWLLPRKILEEVGGFNPLFFHYAEDNDYLQRLHYWGIGIYFVSGTYCYHDRANVPAKLPSKQSIYQQLILRSVDINYSPFMCMLHRWRYGIAIWHTALLERRAQDIRYYYQALGQFCAIGREINENRTIIKQKGAHWIE